MTGVPARRSHCRSRIAAAAWLLGPLGGAQAADFPGPVRWGGTVTVASETVRRGVSWSGGRAAVDAELSVTTDQGWRASLGADTPAYPEAGARAEWTLGASRTWQIDADWTGQASLKRYTLVGASAAAGSGYTELGLTAAWQGRAFLAVALSPDRRDYDADRHALRSGGEAAVEVGLSQRLAGRLSFDAGLGWATLTAGRRRSYAYGSVGLRWGVGPFQAQLGWVDSQAEQRGVAAPGRAGSRVVASASLVF